MNRAGLALASAAVLTTAVLLAGGPPAEKDSPAARYPFVFRDAGDEAGLFPHVAGIRGHAAGWGDVDGDGWIDLYVGTFHTDGSKANLFFRNVEGKFRLDEQEALRLSTRARAALPSPCTDEALPTTSSASAMAARASERSGAVAL